MSLGSEFQIWMAWCSSFATEATIGNHRQGRQETHIGPTPIATSGRGKSGSRGKEINQAEGEGRDISGATCGSFRTALGEARAAVLNISNDRSTAGLGAGGGWQESPCGNRGGRVWRLAVVKNQALRTALMRERSFRLKPKAAPVPRMGRGPGV